jgi:uncharacterized RDD family membrane protein YckC
MQVISVNNNYSSGMRRLAAFFIDHLVVGAILSALAWPMLGWRFGFDDFNFPFHWHNWDFSFMSRNFLKETFIIIYYALMESSKYQATLGKIAMGIKVVNKNNQPLDFSKALLRNLSKLLSAFILGIGYIMIIFDDRKQGLHDKIADTFVVKQ